jgi:hypothetical protein
MRAFCFEGGGVGRKLSDLQSNLKRADCGSVLSVPRILEQYDKYSEKWELTEPLNPVVFGATTRYFLLSWIAALTISSYLAGGAAQARPAKAGRQQEHPVSLPRSDCKVATLPPAER